MAELTDVAERPGPSPGPGRRMALTSPVTLVVDLLLALLVVGLARWGPDWPAQEFRAGLARSYGLLAWDDRWFGGHALLGYSVLYPMLAAVLGASLTGVLAVVASSWCVQQLLPSDASPAARRWVGVGASVGLLGSLVIGQVPFLLGLAFGLAAVRATLRGRAWVVVAAAAACSLASPLAGLFLLLTIPALAAVVGRRRSLLLCAAALGPVVSAVAGGGDGPFPCPWTDLVGVLGFCALAWVASDPGDVVLRRLSVTYAVAVVAAFSVPNPVGGNISRIGKIAALPLVCWLLTRDTKGTKGTQGTVRLLAASLVPALMWFGVPLASQVADGAVDPSRQASYYSGLLTFLRTQDPLQGRLEIPFTREHWETSFVARSFPLARGWERQTDRLHDGLLYGSLTAASYRSWLDETGVALVALPDVPLDGGGRAESRLLAAPPSYLRLVFADRHWTVWRVVGAQPMTTGPATLTQLGPASFGLDFASAGTAVVRIRTSRLWEVSQGSACVGSTSDGWLTVNARAAGPVQLRARLGWQLLVGPPACG
ncbi:MAG TPA: hypothetical protein VIJ54_03345 [Actinomycetes bacterium]